MIKRRFRGRSRKHGDHTGVPRTHHPRKFSFGLLWIILALVVLAVVIAYDRRAIYNAREHIEQAQDYETSGLYQRALQEYNLALTNKRLGRKQKAQVALAIGDIYFDHFENYDMAHNYFVQAKQNAPKLLQKSPAQERLRLAQQRSAGAGALTSNKQDGEATTSTIIQRVELISVPSEDMRGPVVAKLQGSDIRAGELMRLLREAGKLNDPKFRDDPGMLEAFLQQYLDKAILYEAGIDANLHRDVDVTRRLYDYQRSLISERYLAQKREASMIVPNKEVEEYYHANRSTYIKPPSVTLGMIKLLTAASAEDVLQRLRKGETFADLATSASTDVESAKNKGIIGTIKETDDTIPGVGRDPDVVKALINMAPNSITGVTPVNGSFYIFKILNRNPGRHTTLDEARSEIEAKIRGQRRDDIVKNLSNRLRDEYKPVLEQDNLRKFWQFVSRDNATSATEANTATSTSTNLLPEAGKK